MDNLWNLRLDDRLSLSSGNVSEGQSTNIQAFLFAILYACPLPSLKHQHHQRKQLQ